MHALTTLKKKWTKFQAFVDEFWNIWTNLPADDGILNCAINVISMVFPMP